MLKKFVYSGAVLLSSITTAAFASQDARLEFEEAWKNPQYTQYAAPVANINELLAAQADANLNKHKLTGGQLWDVEKKKAWDPQAYIPHAVIKGKSYDKLQPNDDETTFMRRSIQRSWLDQGVTVDVLEEVHVFEKLSKVVFLGRPVNESSDFSKGQPIFHVEHSVGGTEENPLSLWRIIMLTPDQKYVQTVDSIMSQRLRSVPRFVVEYLKRDVEANSK